jgi:Family of unknown function (DUF6232)/Putative peptidoglycan binding domain
MDAVYFNRRGVLITGSWLEVGGRRYAIGEVAGVWAARRPPGPLTVWVVRALWAVVLVTLMMDSMGKQFGILAVLLVLVVMASAAVRMSRRTLVLYAWYQGRTERLVDGDGLLLNQLRRALRRAQEDHLAQQQPGVRWRRSGNELGAPEYAVFAGFAVVVLLGSLAIAGVHRNGSPAPVEPPSSAQSAGPTDPAGSTATPPPPRTSPPSNIDSCDYVGVPNRPVLNPGDTDTDTHAAVTQLQCLINHNSGYPSELVLDGLLGPQTEDAVIWVQECNGIYPEGEADGIVDDATWDKLYTPNAGCAP